jgi:hypothetical protein
MNTPLFILKSNWDLLEKYGYSKPDLRWVNNPNQYEGNTNDVIFEHLNNIPLNGLKVLNDLKTELVEIDELFDTIAYVALIQADWFYSKLNGSKENHEQFERLKQLASLINALKEVDYNTTLVFKKGKRIKTLVNNYDVLRLFDKALTQHISRQGFIPDIIDFDGWQLCLTDFINSNINFPKASYVNLKNILRTIFISKLHEFIRNECEYYYSNFFYTRLQREVIYDIGKCLEIFPCNEEWQDNDPLKHLYRDNIKLLKNILNKSGRIRIP